MHSNFNVKITSISGNPICIMGQDKVLEPVIKPKVEAIRELPKVEKINKPRRKKNV